MTLIYSNYLIKKKIWLLLHNTAEIISKDVVSNLQFVTLKDLSASQHPHSWHLGAFTMSFLTYPCSLSVSLSITCFCSSLSHLAPPMSLLARFTSAVSRQSHPVSAAGTSVHVTSAGPHLSVALVLTSTSCPHLLCLLLKAEGPEWPPYFPRHVASPLRCPIPAHGDDSPLIL